MLLRGVNDDATTMTELLRGLVAARVKPYYLHHGDLARGTAHRRTTIAAGQEVMRQLRGAVSGLCQPSYVLDLPGGHGKVPIGPTYLRKDEEGRWRGADFRRGADLSAGISRNRLLTLARYACRMISGKPRQ